MPLTGIRVLDLTRLLPGPFATMLLTGLGADVVKVEDTEAGDALRAVPPLDGDMGAMFVALNRGKRSLRLDLKSERGRELFLALAEAAHVVVESFRPGVMDRLGLGFDVLHARNPRLVVCSISGYGADGPDQHRAGHDLGYIARAGVLAAGGETAAPRLPGVQMADMGGGGFGAVIAVLAALRLVDRDGVGRHCDVSMTDAVLSWMSPQLAAVRTGGTDATGVTLLRGAHPCYRVYRCADGWLTVAALEQHFWVNLCRSLGLDDLAGSAFATGEEALHVSEHVESVFLTATRAQWRSRLEGEDVCVEPVLSLAEVIDDPQVRHRACADATDRWFPFRIGDHAAPPDGDAPACGADSRTVLAEVGVAAVDFDELAAAGVTA